MARYIALLKFTEQGAKNIKKSTTRAHAFDKLAEKAGVKIEGQYWTMGRYDGVLILNADDATKALHWLTELAALGSVRTETLQAFADNEFERIVGTTH
ncbi:MAG TPA: GYD domain-containing protein [Candidatus Saccharimonadales bacterium]|nr:GYD domain-containing protein [Candidatus Saccharimonadales bacterium]